MESEINKIKNLVKEELANFLGIEKEDIDDETSFSLDLHMKASDLSDFTEILKRMEMDVSRVDFSEVDLFSELIEALTVHE